MATQSSRMPAPCPGPGGGGVSFTGWRYSNSSDSLLDNVLGSLVSGCMLQGRDTIQIQGTRHYHLLLVPAPASDIDETNTLGLRDMASACMPTLQLSGQAWTVQFLQGSSSIASADMHGSCLLDLIVVCHRACDG